MPPTLANGKICYIEIPDVQCRRLHRETFGWVSGSAITAVWLDDTTGEVSGSVTGLPPASEPGFMIYTGRQRRETVDTVSALGCEIVQPIGVTHRR
jgi:hypothetical protein